MAETYKVLAQLAPTATTLTALYTVPAATQAVCSTLIVCNRSATPTTYRLSVAIAGAADAVDQYLAYDLTIGGRAVQSYTIGATLAATDVVRVYVNDATVTFTLFGTQLT